jgi:hypothetical protein
MDEQPQFHEAYAALTAGLPPSQIRLALSRLTTSKVPLTAEEIAGEHPRVQACLEKIAAAYTRKKARSATSSKARRDDAREKQGAASSEPRPRTCVDADDSTVELSLAACSVTCDAEAVEPVAVEPEPVAVEPEPVVSEAESPPAPAVSATAATKPSRRLRCLTSVVRPAAAAAAAATAAPAACPKNANSLVSRRA